MMKLQNEQQSVECPADGTNTYTFANDAKGNFTVTCSNKGAGKHK